MSRTFYGMLALAVAVTACSSPTATSEDGTFSVLATGTAFTLTNGTNAPAFYFVVERGTSASILWIPCVDLTGDCSWIPPRDEVRVRYTDVFGYRNNDQEALVYWWFAVRGENGAMEPDSIRFLIVPF